jgi:hypothetical protein
MMSKFPVDLERREDATRRINPAIATDGNLTRPPPTAHDANTAVMRPPSSSTNICFTTINREMTAMTAKFYEHFFSRTAPATGRGLLPPVPHREGRVHG